MDLRQIKPAVKNYIKTIKKDILIEKVILFGSFAEGRATKESDVDIIILSDKFSKMDDDQRLKFLYRRSVGFPYNLHVYGFTPAEFSTAGPLTTVAEARHKGIRIA